VKIRAIIVFLISGIVLIPKCEKAQIFQGKGVFKGKIASVDICDNSNPAIHDANFSLGEKQSDSTAGTQGAKCKVRFDGEQTGSSGPDTATRTLDLSCYYTNADFGNDKDNCGSRTEFSTINYTAPLLCPDFYKPLWNVTIDISFSGEEFLNENVFVRVEVTNNDDDSKSITSLILPCDDQNAFSGDSPGEILDMPAGKYTLKIYQPDYAALNQKSSPLKHKAGKLYIKYKVMITGHS
jgi:hypothetical protein